MTSRILTAAACLAALTAVGCGGSSGNRPKTYPVTGVVTLGGQPVEGATVRFQLASGAGNAIGTTDAKGVYKLSTFGGDDGARPGDYKVSIVKHDRPAAAPKATGQLAPPPDEKSYNAPDPAAAPTAGPKNHLPEKYANPETSQLTAKVVDSGKNKFDFPLQP